jgi:hypothetical protein
MGVGNDVNHIDCPSDDTPPVMSWATARVPFNQDYAAINRNHPFFNNQSVDESFFQVMLGWPATSHICVCRAPLWCWEHSPKSKG